MPLTDAQEMRYARHLILDEVGEEGQEKLLASKVLVVGAGGLGSPVLMYLAAAGVGTLGVIDDGCWHRIPCGDCAANEYCGDELNPNVCIAVCSLRLCNPRG